MLAGSSKGFKSALRYRLEEDFIEDFDPFESTLVEADLRPKYRPFPSEIVLESKICEEWKLGRCNKGEKCRFRHQSINGKKDNLGLLDEGDAASVSGKLKEKGSYYATKGNLRAGNNLDDKSNKKDDTKSREGDADDKEEGRDSQNEAPTLFFGALMTLLALEQIRQLLFKGGMDEGERERREQEKIKNEIEATQRRLEMFDGLGKTRREEVIVDKHIGIQNDSNGEVDREETRRWVDEEEFESQTANASRILEALERQKRERRLSAQGAEENLEGNAGNEELPEIQIGQESVDLVTSISQYIVLESNLVTCGPGLEIRQITPGYDLYQISLRLPIETTGTEIVEMLLEEGLDSSDFHILRVEESGKELGATILTNIRFASNLERNEEAFGNRNISFEVRRDAIWTSGTMDPGDKKPSLMLTWDSESSSYCEETSHIALAAVYDGLFELEGVRMESCCLLTPDSESAVNQVELTVEFDKWENALAASRKVQSKRPKSITSFQATVPSPNQRSIDIPLPQYEAQRKQWMELSDTDREEGQIEIEVGDEVIIRVQGENKALVGALKVRVERLARGEILQGVYWHPSFASSEEAARFFSDVMENAKVYLKCDPNTHTLAVYGESDCIEEARRMIQAEVDRRELVMTKTALAGTSIGFFEYGGIQKLKELVGEENVDLRSTAKWSAIMMRGGEMATHHLRRLIKESLIKDPTAFQEPMKATICPVCFEEQLYPEMLGCGHGYCSRCLDRFLNAAAENQKFPILCIGEGATCNVPIALQLIRHFLPYHTFKHLVEAAFATYLQQNPTQFRYCKTPDCRQTYRQQSTDQGSIITCPSCFAKTCSSCSESHENMTCAEYRILRDPEEQERLNNELADLSGYKRCPRCAVWVEKTGGCNHMTCRCGIHWGWA